MLGTDKQTVVERPCLREPSVRCRSIMPDLAGGLLSQGQTKEPTVPDLASKVAKSSDQESG
jgi:hypothetical protein